MDQPVVSFAGPLIKANKALTLSEDLLERRRFTEGIEQLRTVMAEAINAIVFIQENYAKDIRAEKAKGAQR